MHLCFVFEGYPTKEDPFMPFVRELVAQFVLRGVKCSVIAPQSISRAYAHKLPIRPNHWKDYVDKTHYIDVYQPKYLSFSNKLHKLGQKSMAFSAKAALHAICEPIDALYAHFWHMGVVASKISDKLPIFVACGESRIEVFDDYSNTEIDRLKAQLAGVIFVGTKSYEDAKALGLLNDTPYVIAPNGYNPKDFHLIDKQKCRTELGWPEDAFIVSFVGSFNKRKGVNRLSEALSDLDDVYSCFIGSGDILPACNNILFSGKVPHDEIAKYLNATDAFVLPTNNEGCCNAIVEALACGLPVISSNQLFNSDILDSNCSIQIDPMNVEAIRNAIIKLNNNSELLRELSEGAIHKAKNLTITSRGQKIILFVISQLHLESHEL